MSRIRRIGALLAVVPLAAASYLATELQPGLDDRMHRFELRGSMGERLSTEDFAVTIEQVLTARRLTQRKGLRPEATSRQSGVWVAVLVRAATHRRPTRLTRSVVRDLDTGAEFAADPLLAPMETLADRDLQPGMDRQGALVFEVPPEVTGHRLELVLVPSPWLGVRTVDYGRYAGLDELVVVPLRLPGTTYDSLDLPLVRWL